VVQISYYRLLATIANTCPFAWIAGAR